MKEEVSHRSALVDLGPLRTGFVAHIFNLSWFAVCVRNGAFADKLFHLAWLKCTGRNRKEVTKTESECSAANSTEDDDDRSFWIKTFKMETKKVGTVTLCMNQSVHSAVCFSVFKSSIFYKSIAS